MTPDREHLVTDVAKLDDLYGRPSESSLVKEVDFIHPHYRALIEAAPFVALATCGPGGLDVSPRGDAPGFVHVEDETTLLLPDRRGNNRVDSLRNLVADPRMALLFLIPGIGETLRVNGRAAISVSPALLARFAVDGKPPRSVLIVNVETVFFQCSRAILRSDLWNPEPRIDRAALPSMGTILADLSDHRMNAEAIDKAWPERARRQLY
ncbi:MAG: pyridoxamine 5'-phosphate oxidase family protein [Rhodospirillales bacterium]|nr:MAG: pyridoxamine 5'-phosphate oxidase family protein [Rhodospirillales bacterium]